MIGLNLFQCAESFDVFF